MFKYRKQMMYKRWKVTIPLNRIERLFSRGSGNGGQNLHASHSRCLLKFNINSADWVPLSVRNTFIESFGEYISPRGTVVIVREDTRSPTDNEKLAVKQLQSMLDKAEELSLVERDDREFITEQERIKSTKTKRQVERYKDRMLDEKRIKSQTKQSRNRKWDD